MLPGAAMSEMSRPRTTIDPRMKSTVEPLEGNKVKVLVELEEEELEPSIAEAWKQIAKEVRIPGFRPGKAPRKLLERQIGTDYARSEALKNAVPEFYSQAVIEGDVDVIAPPELELTAGEEECAVAFEAVVETRPVVQVAGYGGLRVQILNPEPTESDIDEQVDRLRGQYSQIEEVDRPAADGDYVTIDISGTQDGEEVEGLTADGYLYLIGSGMIVPEFDEQLLAVKAGDEVEFDANHPNPEEEGRVHFKISVANVKERALPELTDEWVADATEFESIDELREEIRDNIATARERDSGVSARNAIGEELAKLVEIDAPASLVASEVEARIQNLAYQLQQRGMQLDDYLRIMGRDPEDFVAELKEGAEESIKVDLALRAVIEAESLHPTDEELDEEIAGFLFDSDLSIEDAREALRNNGQLSMVKVDIGKRKAFEWLVERTEVVDADGNQIDKELLALPVDDHDHDHDHHDHDHD